jgi:hypothetical protein
VRDGSLQGRLVRLEDVNFVLHLIQTAFDGWNA